MKVLGFGYDEVFSSNEPMCLEFNKEKQCCTAYYTTLLEADDVFFIVKNEIILKENMMVLFVYNAGLVQSFITKIDYDKKKIKVDRTWISEKDEIVTIGISLPIMIDEEEKEAEEEEI